jgi:hypothetical protein
MYKSAIVALVAGTVTFDAFAIWATWFTLAWVGTLPPVCAVGFWVVALSSFVVTGYSVAKVRAFRRGQQTRL